MDRIALPLEGSSLGMVGNHGAVLGRIHEALKTKPLWRVHLTVVVQHCAVKGGGLKGRLQPARLGGSQCAMRRHALVRVVQPIPVEGEKVIKRETRPDHPPVRGNLEG